jgi:spore germination cell wall hydrolase CwlJ-like protein
MVESGSYTPEQIERRRAIAMAMMNPGKTPKIEHWAQGLDLLGKTALGSHMMNRADDMDRERRAADNKVLEALMGGGQTAPAAAPVGNAGVNPMGSLPQMPNAAPGKIYGNDEASPLDPPSGDDRDRAIRTIIAEAGNQGPTGMNAVGSVIRNRAVGGGATPSQVVMAPNQFEPWNTAGGRAKMAAIDPNSPQFQQASQALESAYAGNDPTNGATNFYAPKAQAALGRPAPAWDNGRGVDIGDHRFFGGANAPVAAALTQTAQAQPAQGGILSGATPQQRAAIVAGMNASEGSPARAIAMSLMQTLAKPRDQWVDERGADGSFYQKNTLTGERKVVEKSDVLPDAAVRQKIDIAKAAKPETTINNTVNPILKGVGDRFNEDMEVAKASVPQIQGIFEARRALDQGAITGLGADPKLFMAKAANLFGLGSDAASNTEVLRSSIGNSVLAKAKTLGANPSNADRDYIEKVVGGSIALEEKSMRRLLDMQEKWARDAIKRANSAGQKMLQSKPKELEGVAGLLAVDEPPDYTAWSTANPMEAPQSVPAPGRVRKFNPATGKIE